MNRAAGWVKTASSKSTKFLSSPISPQTFSDLCNRLNLFNSKGIATSFCLEIGCTLMPQPCGKKWFGIPNGE